MISETKMEPCKFCGHKTGILSKSGPHVKLSCAACGQYLTFIKQGKSKMALQSIGELWLKEKNGKKFMSGNIEQARISFDEHGMAGVLMYKNDYKTEERHPDYKLMQIVDKEKPRQIPEDRNGNQDDTIPF